MNDMMFLVTIMAVKLGILDIIKYELSLLGILDPYYP